MAHGHIIFGKDTFRNYTLSDSLAAYFGLPLALPSDPEDPESTPISQTWTLYSGFKYLGGSWDPGPVFPVIEDSEGVPTRIEGDYWAEDLGETDWVVPVNAQSIELTTFLAARAAAKPIDFEDFFLRAHQTQQYLADGTLPTAPV